MNVYAWPDAWRVGEFEMRVEPNQRTFRGGFNPGVVQTVDLGGDHWVAQLVVPASADVAYGAALEAFFDRLRGQADAIQLWHRKRPVPLGTLRDGAAINVVNGSLAPVTVVNGASAAVVVIGGTPVVDQPIAQRARSGFLRTFPGRTLLAGDHIGLANGQMVRNLTTTVADANGLMPFEFAPAARSDIPLATLVTWNRPTVNFRLRDGKVPVVRWSGGDVFDSITLDLVEAV